MKRHFAIARKMKGLKVSEAMQLLDISQPTLNAWENERKSPSIEKLERMADVYEVSTDFLLGRSADTIHPAPMNEIALESLPILNGRPVWSPEHGWLLVNAMDKVLVQSNGHTISFKDCKQLYLTAPLYTDPDIPQEAPLTYEQVLITDRVWVEPISSDTELRKELRGWFIRKNNRYVENEHGTRFYFDYYGAKWLGYQISP